MKFESRAGGELWLGPVAAEEKEVKLKAEAKRRLELVEAEMPVSFGGFRGALSRVHGCGKMIECRVWFRKLNHDWFGYPDKEEERQYEIYHYCWSTVLGCPVLVAIEKELTHKRVLRAQVRMSH